MSVRNISGGRYAGFSYYGDMPSMLKVWGSDFYRWMVVKEVEPNPNGIGMLTIYDRRDMKNLQILVPVKNPKQDSKNRHAGGCEGR